MSALGPNTLAAFYEDLQGGAENWLPRTHLGGPGYFYREPFDASRPLQVTDGGFAPASDPTKVKARILRHADYQDGGSFARDELVSLVIGGVVQAANKAKPGGWSTSPTWVEYEWEGADLAGLTAAQASAADFGVAISVVNEDVQGIVNAAHVAQVEMEIEV
jgi:hypothetical protein